MSEHDALRVKVALISNSMTEKNVAAARTVEGLKSEFRRLPRKDSFSALSISERIEEAESHEDYIGPTPPLTLDWLHALRQSFTEMQQDRYHSELCDVLRPDCSCNIVSTWDMIQATVDQHARAHVATMTSK